MSSSELEDLIEEDNIKYSDDEEEKKESLYNKQPSTFENYFK